MKYPRTLKVLASTCQGVLGGLLLVMGAPLEFPLSLIDPLYGLCSEVVFTHFYQVLIFLSFKFV